MNRFKRLAPFFNAPDDKGGAPADPKPQDPPQDDKTVPYERFKSVNEKAKEYEAQLKAFSALGSTDDLVAKLAKLAELEAAAQEAEKAKLTEIERANKEREEALAKVAEYEKQTVELAKQRESDVINFAIKLAAKDSVDPDAVALMLDRSAMKVENGEAVGVAEAIEALKTSKPYLFAKKEPKTVGDENNPPNKGDKSAEQILADLADKARKSGRREDLAAYAEAKAKFQK